MLDWKALYKPLKIFIAQTIVAAMKIHKFHKPAIWRDYSSACCFGKVQPVMAEPIVPAAAPAPAPIKARVPPPAIAPTADGVHDFEGYLAASCFVVSAQDLIGPFNPVGQPLF